MKLTVMIPFNGSLREALPVRSIPFVTDWELSPIAIASTFVRDGEHDWRLKGLKTHSWNGLDYREVPDQDWCHFVIAVEGLSASLPRDKSGTADWRAKSASLLPAGVFVWLDEFAQAYSKDAGKSLYIDGYETDTNVSLRWPVILPHRQIEEVLDGFQQEPQAETILAIDKATSPLLRKRIALISELSGMWPTIENDLSESSRNGLNKAKIGGGDWCTDEAISWAATKGKLKKQKAEAFIRANEGSEIAAILRANFGI